MAANLEFNVSALDKASATLALIAEEVQHVGDNVDELGRKRAEATIDVRDEATPKVDEATAKVEEYGRGRWVSELDANNAPASEKIASTLAELKQVSAEKAVAKIDADKALLEVKLAEVRAEIDRIRETAANFKIDADTTEATAKLAALELQAARLDERRLKLTVDDGGSIDKAAKGLGNVNLIAVAIAAAFPFAAAAILAIPAALMLVVGPAAAVMLGLDGIKAAAAALGPEFANLKAGVSAAFEQGLAPAISNIAGMLPTLQAGLQGTATALSTVATQVTQVASSRAGLAALQDTFFGVNQLITAMAPGIAGLTSNFLELARVTISGLQPLAGIINQLSGTWGELIAQMSASGTAQAAVSGLVAVLGEVLNLLPPLVQAGTQLMATVGPPLAAALHVVGNVLSFLTGPLGSVTNSVLIMVAAWKVFSLVGTGVAALGNTLGSAFSKVSSAVTGAAASATAASTATRGVAVSYGAYAAKAEGAAASTSKLGTVFGKIGNALPLIGAAVVGIGLAYDELKSKADSAATNVLSGSQSFQQAVNDERNQIEKRNAVFGDANLSNGVFATSTDKARQAALNNAEAQKNVTEKITAQYAVMSPLQKAQADVTLAQSALTDATVQYGAATPQAAAAAQDLGSKQIALAQANSANAIATTNLGAALSTAMTHMAPAAAAADNAARSTAGWADALKLLADPLSLASAKAQAFTDQFAAASDPATQFAVATQSVNDAVRGLDDALKGVNPKLVESNGTINTASEAGSKLQTSIFASAQAYQGLYGATLAAGQAQGKGVQAFADAALASQNARQKFLDQAQAAGINADAARKMADNYFAVPKEVSTALTQPGMAKALADSLGLKVAVDGIPNQHSVIVDSLTDDARKKLDDIGVKVTKLPNGKILIDADPSQALQKAGEVPNQVRNATAGTKVDIGANTKPVDQALPGVIQQINTSSGKVNIDGNSLPVGTALQTVLSAINTGRGMVTIDGQSIPANDALSLIMKKIDTSNGTVTIDGNKIPAGNVLAGLVAAIDSGSGTVTLNGQSFPAQDVLKALIGTVQSSKPSMPITAHDAGATATARIIAAGISGIQASIQIVASYVAPKALGDVVASGATGYATGGVHGFADGGMAPFSAGTAQVFRPNALRVTGDRTADDEFYIPDDWAPRTMALGEEWARRHKLSLVPTDVLNLVPKAIAMAGRMSAASGPRGSAITVNTASDPLVTAGMEKRLDQLMQLIERRGAAATINIHDRSGDPTETARSAMLALRLV